MLRPDAVELNPVVEVESFVVEGRRPRFFIKSHFESRDGKEIEVVDQKLAIIPDKAVPDTGVHWQIAPTGTINFVDSVKGTVLSPATVLTLSPR